MKSKTAGWETSEQALRLEIVGVRSYAHEGHRIVSEREDVASGVSQRFGVFSCCLLSSVQVLRSRRGLTFGNKRKRFLSTLPMFVLIFRNAFKDVYFLLA